MDPIPEGWLMLRKDLWTAGSRSLFSYFIPFCLQLCKILEEAHEPDIQSEFRFLSVK